MAPLTAHIVKVLEFKDLNALARRRVPTAFFESFQYILIASEGILLAIINKLVSNFSNGGTLGIQAALMSDSSALAFSVPALLQRRFLIVHSFSNGDSLCFEAEVV
jgi:hypothetical protein